MISFGNFCSFFEVFTETLEQNIRKSHKKCFLDGKEEKFRKISNFKIFEKISFIADKIGGNYVLSANSIKICLFGYFCMQNSYLQ